MRELELIQNNITSCRTQQFALCIIIRLAWRKISTIYFLSHSAEATPYIRATKSVLFPASLPLISVLVPATLFELVEKWLIHFCSVLFNLTRSSLPRFLMAA